MEESAEGKIWLCRCCARRVREKRRF